MSRPEIEINCAGLWLPVKVLLCPDIKGHETLLFGQINALAGNPRGCYASNEYFSKFLGLAKSTVSEYIRGLHEKGLILILRGRDPDGQEERQIFLSEAGAQLFAPDVPAPRARADGDDDKAFAPPKGGLRNTEGGASAERTQNKDINISPSHAHAREVPADFWDRVQAAGGEALADPAKCAGVATPRELLYLLIELPNSPACTVDEVVDAVESAAKWWMAKYGAGSMVNWDLACKKARQFRDARVLGQPVREAAKPKPAIPASPDDPKNWTRERWEARIAVAKRSGVWPEHWGPEPGQDGSFVPADLVALWKGE